MGDSTFDEIFEIERKLRTGTPDIQAVALASIPLLMSNCAPLSVSNLFFRLTSHFLTVRDPAIVQTFRLCAPYSMHLGLHAEEMVRRLGVVWDSNDVRARGMVLCIYGWLADGCTGVAEAVWRVQQSMGREGEEEYEAAVMAAQKMVQVDPQRVLSAVADNALALYCRLGQYSFLRPKILQVLSFPSGDCNLEKTIFYTLAAQISQEAVFRTVLFETLTSIALRIESLALPCLDIFTQHGVDTANIRSAYQ
ncbi:hypothetical protein PSACC_00775 [Paramicrosporidium saccamoebae]|uniref:Uncharacterized protein n=1 Tax=Paramicrosporidium saccamoebae TaxID=1246581 RepID=A0A2H9TNW1_9FUNG|nr:hypothetical protein PSACC_00775 [Paramicrosporidium saccamoebae]